MPLFELPVMNVSSRERDKEIIEKAKNKVKPKKKNNIYDRMEETRRLVNSSLGKYKDEYYTILDYDEFDRYIAKANENGVIAIDTETTGLDPILDKLVGICIYTPGEKPAYIPVNHKDFVTGERISRQLNEEQCGEILRKLKPECKIIMFNATFDIRVLRNQTKAFLRCYWDCYVAARLINENEPMGGNKLKVLHKKYVLKGKEDEFTFAQLFDTDNEATNFASVPIDIAYLYGAHDAIVTYEYYEWQAKILRPDSPRKDARDVYNLFMNIEMPVIAAVADMEDNGITYNKDMQQKLIPEFSKVVDESKAAVYAELDKYANKLAKYRNSRVKVETVRNGVKKVEEKYGYELLDDPVNLDSPSQLAIILYDIMGLTSPEPKMPRGTGEKDVLSKMDAPIAKNLIQYKKNLKLLRDFVIGLNRFVNPLDNKIHGKFNSLGANTGRFASHDPNLQQVPAKGKGKKVRQMFKASMEYHDVSNEDNTYKVKYTDEIEVDKDNWVAVKNLKVNDKILNSEGEFETVKSIEYKYPYYYIEV